MFIQITNSIKIAYLIIIKISLIIKLNIFRHEQLTVPINFGIIV